MSNDATFPAAQRLADLRQAMQMHDIDAWWLPSSDPHGSEYLPEHWAGRAWLSGFDGSVGTLVITQQDAGLWVDSRYWVQAEAQLAGSGISLMKLQPGQPDAPMRWLAESLEEGQCVGFDPAVVSLAMARKLAEYLAPAGIRRRYGPDLLDVIWSQRPTLPQARIYDHAPEWLDETRSTRLARVRAAMAEKSADCHLISTLDDIAWLTQLRGSDVAFNPVFLSHLLIGQHDATLFVMPGKLDASLVAALGNDGIEVVDYREWPTRLSKLASTSRILLDPARISLATRRSLPEGAALCEAFQPSTLAKSCKSDVELAHVRHAMEDDGAALCEFFVWLEAALARGDALTELDVDEKLTAARARRSHFVSRSFATIAGFNANGALPHYHATEQEHSAIGGNGLLLIDSGGQYLGGTTDITRVVPVGEINELQREDYTLVLKGMISLSRAHFPRGIPGPQLDAIARAPLWATGRDYGHGTGHGVGYFLNVHEGPQVISWHAPVTPQGAMQSGMITSIEPGLYRPGEWGIRIENLAANRPADDSQFGDFLCFETLTLCPIDTRPINLALLSGDEVSWLNAYHADVRKRLAPKLEGDALAWLEKRTQPLVR